jgi:uridine kinase
MGGGVVPLTRADAAAWVSERLRDLPGTRWVGIDGLGAAGKTSFAAEIASMLPEAHIVHVDDFARPEMRGWEQERFVRQVVEPLLAGRPARYQRWDYIEDRGLNWVDVPVGVPVIVEGVSATDHRLPVPWDVTIWLDVSEAERHRRILARDNQTLLARWRDDWWPNEAAYEREQRPQKRPGMVVVAG